VRVKLSPLSSSSLETAGVAMAMAAMEAVAVAVVAM
jgi:hypothetical protein